MARYRPGEFIVEGVRVVRRIGKGGYGTVYEVRTPGGFPKAVKVVDLQEAPGLKEFKALRVMRNLRSNYLVPIDAYWLKDANGNVLNLSGDGSVSSDSYDELVIQMGLGDMSLLDRLRQCQGEGKRGIPVRELLRLMEHTAEALDYLNGPHDIEGHRVESFQHGDIKPANILLVGRDSAQVCDYGLIRAISLGPRTTQALFTAAYCAPEMVRNEPTRWSDQFSLAITYYELLTGHFPFDETLLGPNPRIDNAGTLAALEKLDFSDAKPGEQAALKRATDRIPSNRFPTCVEFVKALKRSHYGPGTEEHRPLVMDVDKPRRPLPQRLRQNEEIVPGYQLHQCFSKGEGEEFWKASKAKKPFTAYVIRKPTGNFPPHAIETLRALFALTEFEHDNLLNLHDCWMIRTDGTDVQLDDMANLDASAEGIVVILDNVEKTLHEKAKEFEGYEKGMPSNQLLDYLQQIALAVDHLNEVKYSAFLDLQPHNILLSSTRKIRIGVSGLGERLARGWKPVPEYPVPEGASVSGGRTVVLDFAFLLDPKERQPLEIATDPRYDKRYPSCKEFHEVLTLALGISRHNLVYAGHTPVVSVLDVNLQSGTPVTPGPLLTPSPSEPTSPGGPLTPSKPTLQPETRDTPSEGLVMQSDLTPAKHRPTPSSSTLLPGAIDSWPSLDLDPNLAGPRSGGLPGLSPATPLGLIEPGGWSLPDNPQAWSGNWLRPPEVGGGFSGHKNSNQYSLAVLYYWVRSKGHLPGTRDATLTPTPRTASSSAVPIPAPQGGWQSSTHGKRGKSRVWLVPVVSCLIIGVVGFGIYKFLPPEPETVGQASSNSASTSSISRSTASVSRPTVTLPTSSEAALVPPDLRPEKWNAILTELPGIKSKQQVEGLLQKVRALREGLQSDHPSMRQSSEELDRVLSTLVTFEKPASHLQRDALRLAIERFGTWKNFVVGPLTPLLNCPFVDDYLDSLSESAEQIIHHAQSEKELLGDREFEGLSKFADRDWFFFGKVEATLAKGGPLPEALKKAVTARKAETRYGNYVKACALARQEPMPELELVNCLQAAILTAGAPSMPAWRLQEANRILGRFVNDRLDIVELIQKKHPSSLPVAALRTALMARIAVSEKLPAAGRECSIPALRFKAIVLDTGPDWGPCLSKLENLLWVRGGLPELTKDQRKELTLAFCELCSIVNGPIQHKLRCAEELLRIVSSGENLFQLSDEEVVKYLILPWGKWAQTEEAEKTEELDAETRRRLAGATVRIAELIAFDSSRWTKVNASLKPSETALELCNKTTRLVGSSAEPYLLLAILRFTSDLPPLDDRAMSKALREWRAAADAATQSEPKHFEGYLLRGIVGWVSHQDDDYSDSTRAAKALTQLQSIDADFQEAAERMPRSSKGYTQHYERFAALCRGGLALWMANCSVNHAEKVDRLKRAEQFSKTAMVAPTLHSDAADLMGCVYEDMEYLTGQPGMYAKAALEFEKARNGKELSVRARPVLNLARCNYRRGLNTSRKEAIEYFDQAIHGLEEYVKHKQEKPARRIEAYYWLAMASFKKAGIEIRTNSDLMSKGNAYDNEKFVKSTKDGITYMQDAIKLARMGASTWNAHIANDSYAFLNTAIVYLVQGVHNNDRAALGQDPIYQSAKALLEETKRISARRPYFLRYVDTLLFLMQDAPRDAEERKHRAQDYAAKLLKIIEEAKEEREPDYVVLLNANVDLMQVYGQNKDMLDLAAAYLHAFKVHEIAKECGNLYSSYDKYIMTYRVYYYATEAYYATQDKAYLGKSIDAINEMVNEHTNQLIKAFTDEGGDFKKRVQQILKESPRSSDTDIDRLVKSLERQSKGESTQSKNLQEILDFVKNSRR